MLASLKAHFADLPDPRMANKCSHNLLDIVIIAICATVTGADDWQEIETFAKSKHKWLQQWLELPNGIPSHDTFERVFRRLDPNAFEACFVEWVSAVFRQKVEQPVIAIDGKTLRGTESKLHLVSAWATDNGISLGQFKVDDKSNEITAIPHLLEMINLKGSIVTIDAMGCQTAIAEQIIDAKANYFLAVKRNQGNLYNHVEGRFASADDPRFANRMKMLYTETVDRRGSLTERRQCWVLADDEAAKMGWKSCKTIVRVRYERDKAGEKSEGTRYFIASSKPDPHLALATSRAHWGIENSLHWTLDVVFKEDQARTQNARAAQNLAVLRRIALNLVRPYKDKKSMKTRRYQAGLDDEFLLRVMQQS